MTTKPSAVPCVTEYLTHSDVCDLVPGLTVAHLAPRRFNGKTSKFLKPTPRTVLYRRSDIIDWVDGSEQSSTVDNPFAAYRLAAFAGALSPRVLA